MMWFSLFAKKRRIASVPSRRPSFRPRLEALEDRCVPAVFTVNTVDDTPAVDLVTGQDSDGNISLRSAIQAANATPGADTITFALPDSLKTPGGWWTIQLQAGLPTVTDTVAIDGASAPGYTGAPLVELRGPGQAGVPGMDGITFGNGSGGSAVRGLVLDHFADLSVAAGNNAIHITGSGATGIVIAGNYIGTDPTGAHADWNGTGVLIDGGASGNTVGGTTAADRNVISGNLNSAVILTGSGTQLNVVAGNYIGTDVSGLAAVPNIAPHINNDLNSGVVSIYGGASDNLIGGSAPGAGNLISGNNPLLTGVNSLMNGWGDGIIIKGVGTDRNRVQGNLIGTDWTGNTALPNHDAAVRIGQGAQYNVIGTDGDGVNDATEGNVLSGNRGDGVDITSSGTDFNVVAGNIIGLGQDGSTVLGNEYGVGIWDGATGNRVGTNADCVSDELERNVISGSGLAGVEIGNGDGTAGNVVAGNYIGTDKSGLLARGNLRSGVELFGAGSNRIGGTTPVERNVISGNGYGVMLDTFGGGPATSGVQVFGNYIGTDKNGAPLLGNGVGVYLADSSLNNVIGGADPGAGNLIAGNSGEGILIQGDSSAGNTVSGNSLYGNGRLGIDLGGTFATGDGVTPNDLLDTDTGPNGLQNFPILTAGTGGAATGILNSIPNTTFRIEFFANILPGHPNTNDPNDHNLYGEGQRYIGSICVTTDAAGNASFVAPLAALLPGEQYLTTTATNLATGDTSEFSNAVAIMAPQPLTVNSTSSIMLVGNNPPPLTGFVNGTPFTGSITFTDPRGDTVTVTLGTAATSASPVGQYDITATLSGPGKDDYFIDPATSHFGTMYVVSVGADPSSSTGAKAVTFWDNKGNATLITAADLSSLDVLNLVNQGGAAFDPRSVAQLQAWLSISPNATTAYQLAVDLAVMDLNVLAGNVQATDLVFAGALLPYASADTISGLTSGGFIDVQSLMSAANAVLSLVNPGDPSGDPNQAYEAALAQVLQAADGNSDFVQQEVIWNLFGL